MDLTFDETDELEGVRFNWNLFPSTRLDASQLAAPLGCLYTPLFKRPKDTIQIPEISKNPIQCSTCGNYINPYIKFDRANMMWWCPFCEKRTFLPDKFHIPNSGEEWPKELGQTNSTIEYRLPESINETVPVDLPLVYMFIVDLYKHIDEKDDRTFENLIDSIVQVIDSIAVGSLIGLITFDTDVNVHNLQDHTLVVFRDELLSQKKNQYKDIFETNTISKILDKLNLQNSPIQSDYTKSPLVEKHYLIKLDSTTKPAIVEYLKKLSPKFSTTYKPARSSGLAHYVSSILLSTNSYKYLSGKVIFFTTGPGTCFPGTILNTQLSEKIRSHNDIVELNAPNFLSSRKFYNTLSYIANGQTIANSETISSSVSTKTTDYDIPSGSPRWSIDLFAGSLDQVGIYEMKALSSNTMGNVYLFESFGSFQFKETLLKTIDNGSKLRNELIVKTSNNLKLSRLIGDVGYTLPSTYKSGQKLYNQHHEKISDTVTKFDCPISKKEFSNRWSFNTLSDHDTLSLIFEMNTASSSSELSIHGPTHVYIQFQLKYWDPLDSCWKLRITTVCKPTTLSILIDNQVKMSNGTTRLLNSKSLVLKQHALTKSFDQKCWLVILSRLLINKIDTTIGFDKFDNLLTLIDDTVVELLHNFGGVSLSVKRDVDVSNPFHELEQQYEINDNFKALPGYTYSLRRNPQLIKIFNSSPDETAFYHNWFMKSSCKVSLGMIQPKLYQLGQGEIPLDSNCLTVPPNNFLIMDTIFLIIIYCIKDDIDKLPLHPSNNDDLIFNHDKLIEQPMKFVTDHLLAQENRLIPKYVITQTNHSQARFLTSRLNPIDVDLSQEFSQLSVKDSGFWDFFKKKSLPQSNNRILMTDDISLKQYYNGLIKSIQTRTN